MLKNIFIFINIVFLNIFAQNHTKLDINNLIENLHSNDYRIRAVALRKLRSNESTIKSVKVQNEIISLLKREIPKFHNGKYKCETQYDGEPEYIHSLIMTVAKLKRSDTFDLIKKTGAVIAYIEYGEEGIREIIDIFLQSKSLGPIGVLKDAIKRGKVKDSDILKKIKNICLESLNDERIKHPNKNTFKESKEFFAIALTNSVKRKEIIRILGEIGSQDIIPVLKNIAQEDPYMRDTKSFGSIYPVREEAQKILQKINQ